MARLIIGAQVWSVVTALILVAILLFVTYRRLRPTLVAMIPLILTIAALLFSPLRPHHHISGIMWVSMTVAALSALLVIPALLPREGVELPSSDSGGRPQVAS